MKTKAKRWVELADRLEDIENELREMARRWSDEDRARLQADRDRHAQAEAARAAPEQRVEKREAAEAAQRFGQEERGRFPGRSPKPWPPVA